MADPTNVSVVVDKVTAYLDTVAAKLGVAAGKVWPWLVKQQILEGISTGLLTLVGLVGCVVCIKGMVKWYSSSTIRRRNEDWDDANDRENQVLLHRVLYTCIGIIFALMLLIAGLEFMNVGMWKLFNPEYHALMDLIKAVK